MSWVGSLIDAGANILGNIFGWSNTKNTNTANAQQVAATNAANLKIAENTNAMNQAINERNIQYQQAENAITREREDNAVQRRANDLVAAGLSKTLAAGSPAAANALQAPQATVGMQTGHSMQAARANSFNPNIQTNFETAMNHQKQNEIADKEADAALISAKAAAQRAKDEAEHWSNQDEETKRHNEATEAQNAEYHGLQDKWHQAELDQNSSFHEDAMRLSQAELDLKEIDYLNKWDQMEIQNAYYEAQTELQKVTTDQMAARLTADLAESAARVSMYYSETRLNTAELDQVKQYTKQCAAMTSYILAEKYHLNVQTKSVIADVLTKMWNLATAKAQGSTTTSTTVSSSVASENAAARSNATKNVLLGVGIGAVAGAFGAAIRPFVGGAAGFIMKKMFGDDSHNLDPADFVR